MALTTKLYKQSFGTSGTLRRRNTVFFTKFGFKHQMADGADGQS